MVENHIQAFCLLQYKALPQTYFGLGSYKTHWAMPSFLKNSIAQQTIKWTSQTPWVPAPPVTGAGAAEPPGEIGACCPPVGVGVVGV